MRMLSHAFSMTGMQGMEVRCLTGPASERAGSTRGPRRSGTQGQFGGKPRQRESMLALMPADGVPARVRRTGMVAPREWIRTIDRTGNSRLLCH